MLVPVLVQLVNRLPGTEDYQIILRRYNNIICSISSPRMVAPVAVQQQQQQQQHMVVQQQPQQQPQQQQHTTGQMVQLGAGGPTGTLVFSGPAGGNAMFPALAPTGGQFFLQPQAGGGGFQLIVRPPPAPTPPSPAQQGISSPANAQQPRQQQPATIVMQPQLGPTVLNHRQPSDRVWALSSFSKSRRPTVQLSLLYSNLSLNSNPSRLSCEWPNQPKRPLTFNNSRSNKIQFG